ncbi:Hypothetical predicted protein [Lecanosticta acicola]|uniref:Uncharacterized protein n=1 Tax=Lecanosticta acicola TaxID=111012 RepID=A0AAI8YTY8_9PEZI|nr:Hypothetical predicted protein [Lecanosticta acicola]
MANHQQASKARALGLDKPSELLGPGVFMSMGTTPKSKTRESVLKMIQAYAFSATKPPFSIEELVIMSVIDQNEPVTILEAQKWVYHAIGYYREEILNNLLSASVLQGRNAVVPGVYGDVRDRLTPQWGPIVHRAGDYRRGYADGCYHDCSLLFRKAFYRMDLPLEKVSMATSAIFKAHLPEDKWFVPSNEVIYFSQSLTSKYLPDLSDKGKTKCGRFRFLDLLPEIRVIIYELVFAMPKSGVHARTVFSGPPKVALMTVTRDYDAPLTMDPPTQRSGYQCPPLSELFAFTLVNKKIYEESAHVFYAINTFNCDNLRQLETFLRAVPCQFRQHLTHLTFTHCPSYAGSAWNACELLTNTKNLKKLDIQVDEKPWLRWLASRSSSQAAPSVSRIPGLVTLRDMRGLKVRFHGDCEGVKEYLERWMTMAKPKSEAEAAAGNTIEESNDGKIIAKRKAVDDGQEGKRAKKGKGQTAEGEVLAIERVRSLDGGEQKM